MEKKLHTSINEVMKEVKNIEKNLTVGVGKSSYKGVSDKDVKYQIGQSMAKHGLTCLVVDIQPTLRIERWVESSQYGDNQKQQVFTEVVCKFKITHAETGESETIVGYGHGVDSQDKSAGKATTYALKNALLYTFLVPTGTIDDADVTHSETQPIPAVTPPPKQEQLPPTPVNESNPLGLGEELPKADIETFNKMMRLVVSGKRNYYNDIELKYDLNTSQKIQLKNAEEERNAKTN
jgi:hypothetical protein